MKHLALLTTLITLALACLGCQSLGLTGLDEITINQQRALVRSGGDNAGTALLDRGDLSQPQLMDAVADLREAIADYDVDSPDVVPLTRAVYAHLVRRHVPPAYRELIQTAIDLFPAIEAGEGLGEIDQARLLSALDGLVMAAAHWESDYAVTPAEWEAANE